MVVLSQAEIGKALLVGAMLPFLLAVVRRYPARASQTRSASCTQTSALDFRSGQLSGLVIEGAGDDARLSLEAGARSGSYLSPAKKTDFPFNAIGARWKVSLSRGSSLALEVRSSAEGQTWSEWFPIDVVDQFAGLDATVSELIVTSGSYLQYRATLRRDSTTLQPSLDTVTLTYIDSMGGPTTDAD